MNISVFIILLYFMVALSEIKTVTTNFKIDDYSFTQCGIDLCRGKSRVVISHRKGDIL